MNIQGGTQIVQQLIEDVTGKKFSEVAKEMVFDPLNMKDSTFELLRPEEVNPETVVSGHLEEGQVVEGGWHIYPESAAAGLWTTPSDLAQLVVSIQNNTLLTKKETTQDMLRLQPNSHHGLGPEINPSAQEFFHGGDTEGFVLCMAS